MSSIYIFLTGQDNEAGASVWGAIGTVQGGRTILGKVGGHKTSNRPWARDALLSWIPQDPPTEAALSRKRPRRELPAENSRRREGSGRSAPGARWAPLACAPTAARSRRSHSTTPFRIGRARNPGAGTRGPTLLEIGHRGGRTCSRRSWFAGGSRWMEGGLLSAGPLSVIGSLRFPWGRGAAGHPGLLPAGLEAAESRSGASRGVLRELAGRSTRECERGRAAAPRGTGRGSGTAGSSRTPLALGNAPRPGSLGRVRWAPGIRADGSGVGARAPWPSHGDLFSWVLLEVSLKPSQLFPGCRLRRCLGQGDHLLRAKGKGGDRR